MYIKTKILVFLGTLYGVVSSFQNQVFAGHVAGHSVVQGNGLGCADGKICNPLSAEDIPAFILQIIEILLVFAVPLIVLYIMYAGYLFVTAQGNQEQVTNAKNALLYAILGGVLVLGANLIIDVIQGTVDALQ